MRIAINGAGRIGRLLLKRLMHKDGVEIVAINDIMPPENLVYLIKYDSVYGPIKDEVLLENGAIKMAGKCIKLFNEVDAENLPWQQLNVDLVLECSGSYTTASKAEKHLKAGAKKVLLSTTGADDIPLFIYGFSDLNELEKTKIISPGGCMTNCTTHFIHLFDKHFGIYSLHINVIHSYTSRQNLVDGQNADFRRGRAAATAIIPVKVDLADSLQKLFPLLKGKITALTTRVPVDNGALADFSFSLKRTVKADEINQLILKASNSNLKGIIAYTEDEVVSADIKTNTHSAVVDGSITATVENHAKVYAFFDNEFGFTSRILNWIDELTGL